MCMLGRDLVCGPMPKLRGAARASQQAICIIRSLSFRLMLCDLTCRTSHYSASGVLRGLSYGYYADCFRPASLVHTSLICEYLRGRSNTWRQTCESRYPASSRLAATVPSRGESAHPFPKRHWRTAGTQASDCGRNECTNGSAPPVLSSPSS